MSGYIQKIAVYLNQIWWISNISLTQTYPLKVIYLVFTVGQWKLYENVQDTNTFAGHKTFPAAADCKRNWHERGLHTLKTSKACHSVTHIHEHLQWHIRCEKFRLQNFCKPEFFFPQEQTDHMTIGYCQFYSNTSFKIPEC